MSRPAYFFVFVFLLLPFSLSSACGHNVKMRVHKACKLTYLALRPFDISFALPLPLRLTVVFFLWLCGEEAVKPPLLLRIEEFAQFLSSFSHTILTEGKVSICWLQRHNKTTYLKPFSVTRNCTSPSISGFFHSICSELA